MTEQEITVQLSDDPFDTKTVKVMVPKGTKLMCTEPYALDMLAQFNISEEHVNHLKKCERKESYITKGIISYIKYENNIPTEALIDLGIKHTGVCILSKEPEYILDQIKTGMEVDIKVKPSDNGTIYVSMADAIYEAKKLEIYESIGDKGVAFNGKVIELIHGGYWVDLAGIKCFMPGSLGGLNKLPNFEMLVGKELIVMPITFSKEKDTIVVSHREYLRTLIPFAIDNLKENIKDQQIGKVTGTTKFGIFAEFNECLTGLIPKSDLDEATLAKLEAREISAGDDINFWVSDIITEKKIILTQNGPKVEVWDTAAEKYKPMMVTEGKVTKVTKYGAFVELEKGISGLVHKSKLDGHDLERGDRVTIKIQSINVIDRKISMAMA